MSYSLVYTDRFNACIDEYAKRDSRYLAELMETVKELSQRPFSNPKLQTHAMKGVSGEKRFISYVGGSKGRRLIWARFHRAIVLLLYGEHDIEQQAERLVIEPDGYTGGLTITEVVADGTPEQRPSDPSPEDPGQLFMAWTDDELRSFGFADHEVPILRRLDDQEELLELDMAEASFELAFNLLAYQDPEGPVADRATEEGQRAVEERARELLPQEVELEKKVAEPEARAHFLSVSEAELQELLAAPVEDWMVFLHPDQADLVERSFSGPARVRGAAGTGKTVVGLHRARHLARTYAEPVLFTTYVRNLPPVFAQLFERLERHGAGRVDFLNLHKIAARIVGDIGEQLPLNPDAVDSAFAAAWHRVVNAGSALDVLGLTRKYLRDEIDWIIKGRGLVSLDTYLELPRTGRGTPLAADARRDAWKLYEEYQRQLEQRQVVDFNDLLNRAIEVLILGRAESPYRAVVLDEAQDLTAMGLRFAHLLVGGDREDGLFILGGVRLC